MTLRIPYRRQNPASPSRRFACFRLQQFVRFTVAKTQLQLTMVANKSSPSPSPSFRCNRDDSAPKRFRRRFDFRPPFTFLTVAKTQPHRHDGSLASDHDGSFASPSPSFSRKRDASSFATLPATFHPSATLHPSQRFRRRFSSRRFRVFFFFFFLLS